MGLRLLLVLGAAAVALATATAAAPRSADLDACALISKTQIATVLGFQNVKVLKDIPGRSAKDNTSGVTHSVCNGVAWNGAPPTTPAGVRTALENGSGAGFGIDTWAPDDASSYAAAWENSGFSKLTTAIALGAVFGQFVLPNSLRIHRLLPVGGKAGVEGAVGLTATPASGAPPVKAAMGSWWAYPSHAVVAIGVEETASAPVVAQLDHLAKIGVAHFGLAPLTLR